MKLEVFAVTFFTRFVAKNEEGEVIRRGSPSTESSVNVAAVNLEAANAFVVAKYSKDDKEVQISFTRNSLHNVEIVAPADESASEPAADAPETVKQIKARKKAEAEAKKAGTVPAVDATPTA